MSEVRSHYYKKSMQEKGWKNRCYFKKKDFIEKFYIEYQNQIPIDEKEAKKFLKNKLYELKFLVKGNPSNIYQTKFIETKIAKTEDSIHYDLKNNDKKITITNLIENDFDFFFKIN